MEKRITSLLNAFEITYGEKAELLCQAPGRVDLMGSHTDYNNGFVLTVAINQNVLLAGRKRNDGVVRLRSLNVGVEDTFDVNRPVPRATTKDTSWTNFVRGMYDVMLGDGHHLSGYDLLFESDIPLGSGVSSSAALEVVVGVFLNAGDKLGLEMLAIPKIAQRVENEYNGLQSGIMDQYSSAFGKKGQAILLDCDAFTHTTSDVSSEIAIIVVNTNVPRELVGSEYNDRRADCEAGVEALKEFDPSLKTLRDVSLNFFLSHEGALEERIAKRCRFILEENIRVLNIAEAVGKKDVDRIRQLMLDSFQGSRELYEISSPANDAMMMAFMDAPGFIGGRIAGAGFGGCNVAVIEKTETETFIKAVKEKYTSLMRGIEAEFLIVEPSDGAGVIWKA